MVQASSYHWKAAFVCRRKRRTSAMTAMLVTGCVDRMSSHPIDRLRRSVDRAYMEATILSVR